MLPGPEGRCISISGHVYQKAGRNAAHTSMNEQKGNCAFDLALRMNIMDIECIVIVDGNVACKHGEGGVELCLDTAPVVPVKQIGSLGQCKPANIRTRHASHIPILPVLEKPLNV